jgi:uncharacterized SAM-binding protein YcdF (DUF218 family)
VKERFLHAIFRSSSRKGNEIERPPRRRIRWFLYGLAIVAALVAVSLAALSNAILHDSTKEENHPADAIIVFGAAQYDGRPSPVYRARLDHAFNLFRRGIASVVIPTGGSAADPSYSEGGVGRDYLIRRGIPESNLIAETTGSDTAQSAERVAVIMRANHMTSCAAVSDAYHVFRIRKLLEHQGLRVYVAPRPASIPRCYSQRFLAVMREASSYFLWRLHLNA